MIQWSRRAGRMLAMVGLVAGGIATGAFGQGQDRPLVPDSFDLSEAAKGAIAAEWLTHDERSRLRVFHGVWDKRDLTDALAHASIALNAWDFDHPALMDPEVPAEIRAEALFLQGRIEDAIGVLEGVDSILAGRIRAEALEQHGELREADAAVDGPVEALLAETLDEPGPLTEGVRCLIVRSRLQGQPSRDYQTMMKLLARARSELDRLYWPASLTEASLLLEKHNTGEAVNALHDTLSLNPRSAQAWYMLGLIAIDRFDFDSARVASSALERVHPRHPLAALLRAESRLIQDDPDEAMILVRSVLGRWPRMRPALALLAAVQALQYDTAAVQTTLAQLDAISPGSAQAHYTVGRHLAMGRQYEAAAEMLEEAIRRQPAWPAPQIELGLMEMQSGRTARALIDLERVGQLDPFNKRAANSLFLLREFADDYDTLETEHFIVRYRRGVDEVMVNMMAGPLEEMHRVVSTRFAHEPDRKTIIELMPDHERFGVRIAGMPSIHTIAACTGPVIAMEVPREGAPSKHLGTFDWVRVLRHEYTHTITLSQTKNRIPRWLTEASAVSMELAPRDYDTCVMLALAYHEHRLFPLDEINWAFIRPQRPGDSSQAYAQGHWMVQFIDERFGEGALVGLLDRYFQGEREELAIQSALSVSREVFFKEFLEWAGGQVRAWGLAPTPPMEILKDELRLADESLRVALETSRQARLDAIVKHMTDLVGRAGSERSKPFTGDQWPPLKRPAVEVTDEILAGWLERFPDHPDLLELSLRRRLAEMGDPDETIKQILERYATARPVDPFPHKVLARVWRQSETPLRAIPHLEQLDRHEQKSTVYAVALRDSYRKAGDLEKAMASATRALTINPYHARNREIAAAIAVQTGRIDLARMHIHALTLIEPDRPQHLKRLEAIDALLATGD